VTGSPALSEPSTAFPAAFRRPQSRPSGRKAAGRRAGKLSAGEHEAVRLESRKPSGRKAGKLAISAGKRNTELPGGPETAARRVHVAGHCHDEAVVRHPRPLF
jgi:hypothetical protein